MESEPLPRKLAAILYADVAGYSRLTGEDEDATHRRLREYFDLIAATVERYRGSVMHYAGDAVLAMFDAVADALSCAAYIQRDLETRNEDLPVERKVQFRIGINMGDVIEDRGDIYGDGVNVAARLEGLAEPGGICVSDSVRTAAGTRLPLEYEFLGEQHVKNIKEPVRAFQARLKPDAGVPSPSPAATGAHPGSPRIAVIAAVVAILTVTGTLAWLKLWTPREDPAAIERIALPLPDKTSIAVLPFENFTGDPSLDYLSDGISEDIIIALARSPWLLVMSRISSFVYKGQSVTVQQVGQELGVHYVLEGSMGERARGVTRV